MSGLEPWSTAQVITGYVILAIGLAGFAWAIATQIRGGASPNPYMAATALVTNGPYWFSRNPIYVCDLIVQFGATLVLTQGWALVLLVPTFFGLRHVVVRFEEPHLAERFTHAYADYVARTRRWI
ncbi:MAG: methyltransferase family protein [Thermoplasmatota archaeon]